MDEPAGGWDEYRRLVLSELTRMNEAVEALTRKLDRFRQDDISAIRTEIALLKLKAAMIGAVAGVIPSLVVALVVHWLTK